MKWWQLLGIVVGLGLTACSATQTHQLSKGTGQPPSAVSLPLAQKMVVNAGGNDIYLVTSHAANLRAKLLTAADYPLQAKTTLANGQLTVDFSKNALFRAHRTILLEVPDNLLQLTVQGTGVLHADALPSSLTDLRLHDIGQVSCKGLGIKLNALYLDHVKQARIDGIDTNDLRVSIQDSGPVALGGMMGLRELVVSHSGLVSIAWVNSAEVRVNLAGSQRVYLAGVADLLSSSVTDSAFLEAKYLRLHKAFIHTQANGRAEVSVDDSLNAYAQGHSTIAYYQQPHLLARYYQQYGAILFMGDKPPVCSAPECARMPNPLPG